MKKGLLIIMSGPSGVGKGTIRDLFIDDESLKLAFSISMTTRKPRNGEIDGVHYYFATKEQFEKNIAENKFLEHAEFVGNYYGTLYDEVERLRNSGKNVLLEIEIEGAKQVMEKCPDALSIFILPPSLEELERRIRSRQSEDEETINLRLLKAQKEMNLVLHYKYAVCNNHPKLAADIVALIIKRHMEE